MSGGRSATFLYDFNSPYAFLAACRVDAIMPGEVRWQPVAFAFMLRAHNRDPWSFDEAQRSVGVAECERRARAYGLPEMRWPPGWPVQSYGLASLRGALIAQEHGLLHQFSAAAFRRAFVAGLSLKRPDDVLEVAEEVGLARSVLQAGLESPTIKERLSSVTNAVITAGAVGVPTVIVDQSLFWGDDQLEAAAAAARVDSAAQVIELAPRAV